MPSLRPFKAFCWSSAAHELIVIARDLREARAEAKRTGNGFPFVLEGKPVVVSLDKPRVFPERCYACRKPAPCTCDEIPF